MDFFNSTFHSQDSKTILVISKGHFVLKVTAMQQAYAILMAKNPFRSFSKRRKIGVVSKEDKKINSIY